MHQRFSLHKKCGLLAPLAITLIGLAALGCGASSPSALRDLSTGEHANVGSKAGGAVLDPSAIEAVHFLPNTRVPKGVFVSLDYEDSSNNAAFVKDLVKIIAGINRDEHLRPTIDLAHPTDADLERQEISLAVLVGKGHQAQFDKLKTELGGSGDEEARRMLPLEMDTESVDMWMQDFGTFAAVKMKNVADPAYLVIDTHRNKNRQEYSTDVFMHTFHLPLVHLGLDSDISGQYGGNLGVTPKGTLFIGDSVEMKGRYTPSRPELLEQFRQFGNSNALQIASNWLTVGHVDEYLTYTPSAQACGATLFYGKPMEGLKVLLEQGTEAEFKAFLTEFGATFADESHSTREAGHWDTIKLPLTRATLMAALQSFRRAPHALAEGISADLADYDVSTHVDPLWLKLIDKDGVTKEEFAAFKADPGAVARFYVWRNLLDQTSIEASLAILAKDTSCFQSESLPQVFRPTFEAVKSGSSSVRHAGDLAHLPGMANSLVLRDHVIVPDPKVQAFRTIAAERFAKHLRSIGNVHFIDDEFYHSEAGEVHCGTNVLREMNIDFHF